jgi:hypothetical protein
MTMGAFVMKRDGNDVKRGLACGIFWIENQIAVNPLRFSTLISKSKSSINAGFQALGYDTISIRSPLAFGFADVLHLSYDTIRHWTVRTPITNRVEPVTNPQIRQTSPEGNPVTETNTEDRHSHESHSAEIVDMFPEYVDWNLPGFE